MRSLCVRYAYPAAPSICGVGYRLTKIEKRGRAYDFHVQGRWRGRAKPRSVAAFARRLVRLVFGRAFALSFAGERPPDDEHAKTECRQHLKKNQPHNRFAILTESLRVDCILEFYESSQSSQSSGHSHASPEHLHPPLNGMPTSPPSRHVGKRGIVYPARRMRFHTGTSSATSSIRTHCRRNTLPRVSDMSGLPRCGCAEHAAGNCATAST
jgi:hypothetical protein